MSRTVRVGLGERAYDVGVGGGLLDKAGVLLAPLLKQGSKAPKAGRPRSVDSPASAAPAKQGAARASNAPVMPAAGESSAGSR